MNQPIEESATPATLSAAWVVVPAYCEATVIPGVVSVCVTGAGKSSSWMTARQTPRPRWRQTLAPLLYVTRSTSARVLPSGRLPLRAGAAWHPLCRDL